MAKAIPPEQRFWKYTEKTDTCWEWIGAKTGAGYGVLRVNGKTVCAHRFAYEQWVAPIPEGMHADHICHNVSCVNPSHIRIATPSHNGLRKARRGNNFSGAPGVYPNGARWMAKLGHQGKSVYLGTFATVEEASAAVEAERARVLGVTPAKG